MFPLRSLLPLALLLLVAPLRAHESAAEMAAAANSLLSMLTPEQKAKAEFAYPDDERKNWHFIPRVRKGLPLKELNYEQRLLAQALLASGLSGRGYGKAVSIMSLESVLAILEKDKVGGAVRDPENYFVSVFGKPGVVPWGWRVEGHHLSLNYAIPTDDTLTMTPSFFGTNPGEVRSGPRTGTRILGTEEDLGRTLVKSLDAEQRKKAIILAEAPKEILTEPKRIDPTSPEGILQSDLTAEQSEILVKLMKEYLFRCRPEAAMADWERIEAAGSGQLYFAWAGGIEPGQPHYYRVQGGHFVLEYDNTQNDANHVHTIWRDFDRDFGDDPMKEHVEKEHAK